MNELHALLLSDGRPGHYQLAEGVLEAVRRLRPVRITRIDTSRGRWPGHLLGLASNLGRGDVQMLRVGYGISHEELPSADLIVSAGAETLAASVACARLLRAANIHYGSLRLFRPAGFDLVLTSYRRLAALPRHAMALKPSRIAAEIRAARHNSDLPQRTAGLLIGGDSGECQFAESDWERLLTQIGDITALDGTRWRVSNSRRTPDALSDRLADWSKEAASPIDAYIDVRSSGPEQLAPMLSGCDVVAVTDDSSSMISMIVSAALPTLGVRPRRQRLTDNERDYRAYLSENGWYRSVAINDLTPMRFAEELAAITPLRSDPLDDLAVLIKQRLPGLFATG